jgi:hypothetical protein
VREHLPLLLGHVLADLPHQRRELLVEGRIVGLQTLQPLHRLLRLGVLVLGRPASASLPFSFTAGYTSASSATE